MSVEIKVPDIGDFKDVPIIEVHVSVGQKVAVEDTLITLESDKATTDIPAPQAGTVQELKVKVGDRISQGGVILLLEAEGAAAIPPKERVSGGATPAPTGQPSYGSETGVYETMEVKVPDIGDFKDVPVIEVHVQAGAAIKAEEPLLSLESDKATMDIPAPAGGTVAEVKVKVGDRISQGDLILLLRTGEQKVAAPEMQATPPAAAVPMPKAASATQGDFHAEVLVLGAGPGGYTAAFRAADLGKKVVLVERWQTLGGVCLNVGCIPSKALLHAAKVVAETKEMGHHGISFTAPQIDIDKLRGWKDGVVRKLTGGLTGLAKQRKVTTVQGVGRFASLNQLEVEAADGSKKTVSFERAIIAAGSEPVTLPFIPHDDPG
jgi:dihydrolipoamide dehydrogenase